MSIRDLRIAIDGVRIETAETFAIDWNRVRNDKIYDGNRKKLEQHYAFWRGGVRGRRWNRRFSPRW